jgi:hypothetical protein
MSYLHCPVCSRAFNLAQHPSCPSCAVAATPVDPVNDVVAAAESLARALAQATPAQRAAAAARVQLRSLAPETSGAETAALLPIRSALTPLPQPAVPRRSRWLAALAVTALDRLSPACTHAVAPCRSRRGQGIRSRDTTTIRTMIHDCSS